MANSQDYITYVLDDQNSFYHGRKVIMVRDMGGIMRVVRVIGTNHEMVVSLYELAR